MYDAILKDDPFPIKALWIARHNMINQIPNAGLVTAELVQRLDFIVVADLFMNASACYADIVLPACSFLEQTDLLPPPMGMPGAHKYLQLQQKAIEPLYECRPDLEILQGLAEKMGFGEHFNQSAEEFIELLLSSEHPSVAGITLEKLKEGPVEMRAYDAPTFSTPTGRLEFYAERPLESGQALPQYLEPLESEQRPLASKYPLMFFSTHTRYRVHSVFANVDWFTDLDPEPVLEMNPDDAEPRNIRDGDMVCVFNDRGRTKLKAKVHQGMRPGLVNTTQGWWPEHFIEGSHQNLTHSTTNQAQELVYEPNAALYDVLVEVEKIG
ncbi:molybdopterin-dependent oxidoreductase [Chloroflexota bacterium]